MDLYIKSDPVTIISKDFIFEKFGQDIIQEVQILPTVIFESNRKSKGIQCIVYFQQHSKTGKFFELRTEVKFYFDSELLYLSHLRQILTLAQQYSIDEFFEQVPADREKLTMPVKELDSETVKNLYEKLKREL